MVVVVVGVWWRRAVAVVLGLEPGGALALQTKHGLANVSARGKKGHPS